MWPVSINYLIKTDSIDSSTHIDAAGTDTVDLVALESPLSEHDPHGQCGRQGGGYSDGNDVQCMQDDVWNIFSIMHLSE